MAINYRPVILDEGLEPSYPSTHNLMTLAFFGFTIVNLKIMDIKKKSIALVMAYNTAVNTKDKN